MIGRPLTVTELTSSIKKTLELNFDDVCVEGEISNYKLHSSGHHYFMLKDSEALINCALWKSRNPQFLLKDGMKVIVWGHISVFPPQGKYQIEIDRIQPSGLGDLYLAFEELKNKLKNKGYFDQARKKPIPQLPLHIGIATSPTGAVIRDMIITIKRRFPKCTIYFRPTLVQGENAAEDIAQAISELESTPAEVIIIGRGGGSIEDLWCFNTEIVADAIYNCRKPIISAVGHETDFTISDFVADLRANTPTAAAEIVTPLTLDTLYAEIDYYKNYFTSLIKNHISHKRKILEINFGKHLKKIMLNKIAYISQFLDTIDLQRLIFQKFQTLKNHFLHSSVLINSYNPLLPLDRGFAYLQNKNQILTNDDSLSRYNSIEIIRKYEKATAKITNVSSKSLFE